MAHYISLHSLACLPKPAFAALCKKLFTAPGTTLRRIAAGQVAEKMLVEFEAPDQTEALAWLRQNRLTPVWLMRVDFESTDGALIER